MLLLLWALTVGGVQFCNPLPRAPPEKLRIGLTTLGSRQEIWSLADTKTALIVVPPRPDNFANITKELNKLSAFLDAYEANAVNIGNLRQKDAFISFTKTLHPLLLDLNDTIQRWPTISTATSVLSPDSACTITIQPPDIETALVHATQDLYMGQKLYEIETKTPTAAAVAAGETTTTTKSPLQIRNVLRELHLHQVDDMIKELSTTTSERLALIEQLFNNEVPTNIAKLLTQAENCLDLKRHELIDFEECIYTSLGFTCKLRLSLLTPLAVGYKMIPIPFIPLGEEKQALQLDFTPGTFIDQDETMVLDRSTCATRQEKILCDTQAWATNPCLTAINTMKGDNIKENCKFSKTFQQAKPLIKTTQWGVLIAPRNRQTIKAKWDVEGDRTNFLELYIDKPHILTGQGRVSLTIGVGNYNFDIKETKLNPKNNQAQILLPKINGSLLNLDFSKDIAFPELTFLQSNYHELAQSIVTIVSLIISLAGLPYCLKFCRKKCLRNGTEAPLRLGNLRNNEQNRGTAPNEPQPGSSAMQNLSPESSALLGNITNAAMHTLAYRNK